MLNELLPRVPTSYGKYIEPFFGGGALFFALQPQNAIIADSNPELINMYCQVARRVNDVIAFLKDYQNTEATFYATRAQNWKKLSEPEAAARTIFLNKTCFNGLYRVNKKGEFNSPFGKYKNPNICDEPALRAASFALQRAEIICDDYARVLEERACPGDFIFLDPPYLPVSEFSDFKRYTKEQFYEKDHIQLARLVERLRERGCHLLLTNSNHPLTRELYGSYAFDVISTKRHISCKGAGRQGEDVIVAVSPKPRASAHASLSQASLSSQTFAYPPTRFMGSKSKLLKEIWAIASQFNVDSIVDLFSGSGIVGYMFKAQGKSVVSNDYMSMAAVFTQAMVENNAVTLSEQEAQSLLTPREQSDRFVETTFQGLYFSDEENALIDALRANISAISNCYKRAIATSALIRACVKKRPRGVFTYTGQRYDDGRKDLQKSLAQHFLDAVQTIDAAVFDNGKINRSVCGDALTLEAEADLVYIDPPYYSPLSDNDYVRRYHFVEGLARNWQGVEIQTHTKTKKFKSYPTPFSTRQGAVDAFDRLFQKFADSVLLVSYSSNSRPTQDEMLVLLGKYKKNVDVIPIDYKYSFGNQRDAQTNKNSVQEYLFVGY